tara:strand:- start:2021 stop:2575 length:555 start_codon:yes stop_codon:yes gene_type:complete
MHKSKKKEDKQHASIGNSLKSTVYGGLDGIITTFAIVAGVAGASLEASIVLILGFANLIADGFSMAASDYLSTKSENRYYHTKKLHHLETPHSPTKSGLTTFISFIIFGFIPLFTYVFIFISKATFNPFPIAIILTAIALFILGTVKCKLTKKNWLTSGIETLFIGGIAATAAYLVGYFISTLL